MVAPARERGLKSAGALKFFPWLQGRSREGAWIEILTRLYDHKYSKVVAPARERGLKLLLCRTILLICRGRSREGAWIEIKLMLQGFKLVKRSLPRGSVD